MRPPAGDLAVDVRCRLCRFIRATKPKRQNYLKNGKGYISTVPQRRFVQDMYNILNSYYLFHTQIAK